MLSYMTDQSKASAKKKKTHIHIQTLTALDCMATLHCLNDKLMQGDYQFPNWHITFSFYSFNIPPELSEICCLFCLQYFQLKNVFSLITIDLQEDKVFGRDSPAHMI